MTDERKPVICPNCKAAMQCVHDAGLHNGPQHWYQFACDCGVSTPWEDTVEAAYAAATQRPPNRPLTLPELFDLADDDAAWVVSENGRIWAMGAECAQEWASEERCLFFASKPTNADIEAARKDGSK